MSACLIVTANVREEDRAAFDRWYEDEHLPDAMAAFGTLSARRGWSDVTPGVHIAIYTFRDLAHARRIAGQDASSQIKALIAEFDRVWQGRVSRTREIVGLDQTLTAPDAEDQPMRTLISTGSPFEERFAYSRAVVQGDWCFLAGTTGFDYATMVMPEAPEEQARNIFRTIGAALDEAGFRMEDIVRIQATVTDPAHWEAAAPAVREALGHIRPANTTVVSGLVAPEMKIEIEATAYRGKS